MNQTNLIKHKSTEKESTLDQTSKEKGSIYEQRELKEKS